MRWQDVDLDAGMVRIQQTAQWIDGKGWILKGPKKDASRRSVLLTTDMVDTLRRHRTKQGADRLKLGEAYEDMDLVFASSVGVKSRPI